jgi:pyruvate dehydrogenase E1 component
MAATVPNLLAYDPAYAYEIAVIVRDGLARMYERQEVLLYYLTLYNEVYPMPAMPEGAERGILKGMYRLGPPEGEPGRELGSRVQLLGSGPLLRGALSARKILADRYDVAADVWSVTSYKELRRDALAVERWNLRHPGAPPRHSYLDELLDGIEGPFVAVSDYMKLVPEQIARFLPGPLTVLGTDGFGRSDTREALRRHFEVDAAHVAYAALHALARANRFEAERLGRVAGELGIDPDQPDPITL